MKVKILKLRKQIKVSQWVLCELWTSPSNLQSCFTDSRVLSFWGFLFSFKCVVLSAMKQWQWVEPVCAHGFFTYILPIWDCDSNEPKAWFCCTSDSCKVRQWKRSNLSHGDCSQQIWKLRCMSSFHFSRKLFPASGGRPIATSMVHCRYRCSTHVACAWAGTHQAQPCTDRRDCDTLVVAPPGGTEEKQTEHRAVAAPWE